MTLIRRLKICFINYKSQILFYYNTCSRVFKMSRVMSYKAYNEGTNNASLYIIFGPIIEILKHKYA